MGLERKRTGGGNEERQGTGKRGYTPKDAFSPHTQILHHEPNPNLVVRIRQPERAAHQASNQVPREHALGLLSSSTLATGTADRHSLLERSAYYTTRHTAAVLSSRMVVRSSRGTVWSGLVRWKWCVVLVVRGGGGAVGVSVYEAGCRLVVSIYCKYCITS